MVYVTWIFLHSFSRNEREGVLEVSTHSRRRLEDKNTGLAEKGSWNSRMYFGSQKQAECWFGFETVQLLLQLQ